MLRTVIDVLRRHGVSDVKTVACAAASQRAPQQPIVTLWPCHLGAYLGTDKWLSRDRALDAVWRRTAPANYKTVRTAWQARGRKARRTTAKAVYDVAAGAGGGTAAVAGPGSQDDALDPFPNVKTAEDVKAFTRTHSKRDVQKLYRTKGVVGEADTVQLLQLQLQGTVEARNFGVWYSPGEDVGGPRETLASVAGLGGPIVDPGPYQLVGAVDVMVRRDSDGASIPVEIKTRVGGGVVDPPPYAELLQLQAYLRSLQAPYGLHVQRRLGSTHLHTVRVDRDDALWARAVQPQLDAFVCDVRRLLRGAVADEDLRHRVLLAGLDGEGDTDYVVPLDMPVSSPSPSPSPPPSLPTPPPPPPPACVRPKKRPRQEHLTVSPVCVPTAAVVLAKFWMVAAAPDPVSIAHVNPGDVLPLACTPDGTGVVVGTGDPKLPDSVAAAVARLLQASGDRCCVRSTVISRSTGTLNMFTTVRGPEDVRDTVTALVEGIKAATASVPKRTRRSAK